MANNQELRSILENLVDILSLQAKEIDKLTTHLGRVTVHVPYQSHFPFVVSELSELRHRLRKLRSGFAASWPASQN